VELLPRLETFDERRRTFTDEIEHRPRSEPLAVPLSTSGEFETHRHRIVGFALALLAVDSGQRVGEEESSDEPRRPRQSAERGSTSERAALVTLEEEFLFRRFRCEFGHLCPTFED
jgi:hypothetical protein